MAEESFMKGVAAPRPTPRGAHPFCRRHNSHYCPCVRPQMYAKGDKRGDPAYWDQVQEEARAKKEARRDG